MVPIPNKVVDRFNKTIGRFQSILKNAKDRDINESDTVVIVSDIFCEVFGYDKYSEITREYAIKGTYCDLAIKTNGEVQYLIEVKSIGTELKETHLRQIVNYGANYGVPWIVLTNGIHWIIYRIKFEKPIGYEVVASFNFLEVNPKKSSDREILFLMCKEGLTKSVLEVYFNRIQSINKYVMGAILLSDASVSLIKRELKNISGGVKVEDEEIRNILMNEVLKREIVESEQLTKILQKLKKIAVKKEKPKKKEDEQQNEQKTEIASQDSTEEKFFE